MEFTQEEKDRIIADQKLRHETSKSLMTGGGKCCSSHEAGMGLHGCSHCGGIFKGVILGLVLAALFCFFTDRHRDGCTWGHCDYGSPMMSHPDSADKTK
jgi:hypothetical protein